MYGGRKKCVQDLVMKCGKKNEATSKDEAQRGE